MRLAGVSLLHPMVNEEKVRREFVKHALQLPINSYMRNKIIEALHFTSHAAVISLISSYLTPKSAPRERVQATWMLRDFDLREVIPILIDLVVEEKEFIVQQAMLETIALYEKEAIFYLFKCLRERRSEASKLAVLYAASMMKTLDRMPLFIYLLSDENKLVQDVAVDLLYESMKSLSDSDLKKIHRSCSQRNLSLDRNTLYPLERVGGSKFVSDILNRIRGKRRKTMKISLERRWSFWQCFTSSLLVFIAFGLIFMSVYFFNPNAIRRLFSPTFIENAFEKIGEVADSFISLVDFRALDKLPHETSLQIRQQFRSRLSEIDYNRINDMVRYEDKKRGLDVYWIDDFQDAFGMVVSVDKKYLSAMGKKIKGCGLLYQDVYKAFQAMARAAANDGITLKLNETWRTFVYQKFLEEKYRKENKEATIEAAPAGTSEHHRCAIDIANTVNNSSTFQWLYGDGKSKWGGNAINFGFELSYPAYKTKKLGVKFEPWHWRFNPAGILESGYKPPRGSYLHQFMQKQQQVQNGWARLMQTRKVKRVQKQFLEHVYEYIEKFDDAARRIAIRTKLLDGEWLSIRMLLDYFYDDDWRKQYLAADLVMAFMEQKPNMFLEEERQHVINQIQWLIQKKQFDNADGQTYFKQLTKRLEPLALQCAVDNFLLYNFKIPPQFSSAAHLSIREYVGTFHPSIVWDVYHNVLTIPLEEADGYNKEEYGMISSIVYHALLGHADLLTGEQQVELIEIAKKFLNTQYEDVKDYFPLEATYQELKGYISESEFVSMYDFREMTPGELIDEYKKAIRDNDLKRRLYLRKIMTGIDNKEIDELLLPYLDWESADESWGVGSNNAWKMHYMAVEVLGKRFNDENIKIEINIESSIYDFLVKFLETPDDYSYSSKWINYAPANVRITKELIRDLKSISLPQDKTSSLFPNYIEIPRETAYASIFSLPTSISNSMQHKDELKKIKTSVYGANLGENNFFEKHVQGLKSPDRRQRFAHAKKLLQYVLESRDAVNRVVEHLDNEEWMVRWHMLNIIHKSDCFWLEDNVLERLSDTKEEVIIKVLITLGSMGTRKSIPQIHPFVSDIRYKEYAKQAVSDIERREGMVILSESDKRGFKNFILEHLNGYTQQHRWEYSNRLLQRVNRHKGYKDCLREILKDKVKPEEWRALYHIIRIFKELGDSKNSDVIIPYLKDANSDIVWITIEASNFIGDEKSASALEEFIKSGKHPEHQSKAKQAITNIIRRNKAIQGLDDTKLNTWLKLKTLCGHKVLMHRYYAYKRLKSLILESKTLISRGKDFLTPGSDYHAYCELLYSALGSDVWYSRANALDLLMVADNEAAERFIIPLLNDGTDRIKQKTLNYLKIKGSSRSLNELESFLQSDTTSAQLKAQAQDTINTILSRQERIKPQQQELSSDASEALNEIKQLKTKLRSNSQKLRHDTAESIVLLIRNNPQYRESLLKELFRDVRHKFYYEKWHIINITSDLGLKKEQSNIYYFTRSNNRYLREKTIQLLGEIGTKQAIEVLNSVVRSPQGNNAIEKKHTKKLAEEALNKLRLRHAIPKWKMLPFIAIVFSVIFFPFFVLFVPFILVKVAYRFIKFILSIPGQIKKNGMRAFLSSLRFWRKKPASSESPLPQIKPVFNRRAFIKYSAIGSLLGLIEIYTSFAQSALFRLMNSLSKQSLKDEEAGLKYGTPRKNKINGQINQSFSYYDFRGYTRLKRFAQKLKEQGFKVVRQVLQGYFEPVFLKSGIEPPYKRTYAQPPFTRPRNNDLRLDPEKITEEHTNYGLIMLDRNQSVMFRKKIRDDIFETYDDIPYLLVELLTRAETKPYWRSIPPSYSPVITLRFIYASFKMLLSKLFGGTDRGGGSSIVTQSIKLNRSPGAGTGNILEKLIQMLNADRFMYRDGFDTEETRKDAFVNYCNDVPVGTQYRGDPPGANITGFCDGVRVYFGRSMKSIREDLLLGESTENDLRKKAYALKQIALITAILPRPNAYRGGKIGILHRKANIHIEYLVEKGVITKRLAQKAKSMRVRLQKNPLRRQPRVVHGTAWVSVRRFMQNALWEAKSGTNEAHKFSSIFENMNFIIKTTYDRKLQYELHRRFEKIMKKFNHVKRFYYNRSAGDKGGFDEKTNLDEINYAVYIVQRGDSGNSVLAEYASDLTFNQEGHLNLGSTAKFRVLIDYLQNIEWLYDNRSKLPELKAAMKNLTRSGNKYSNPNTEDYNGLIQSLIWWTYFNRDKERDDLLKASLYEKTYPTGKKKFFTNGGPYEPDNIYEDQYYPAFQTVIDAFAQSTNRVFVRMLEDIRNVEICKWIIKNPNRRVGFNNLERSAFKEIYKRWKKLGYEFEYQRFHPGLQSALGASGDNAYTLMHLFDAVKRPQPKDPTFIHSVYAAPGTPYQIDFTYKDFIAGTQNEEKDNIVLSPAVRDLVSKALYAVVNDPGIGTGRYARLSGHKVFGKTGTGTDKDKYRDNNRAEKFRTASFVFGIDDNIMGNIVVWVDKNVSNYSFTSKVATRIFKHEIVPLLKRHGYLKRGSNANVDFNENSMPLLASEEKSQPSSVALSLPQTTGPPREKSVADPRKRSLFKAIARPLRNIIALILIACMVSTGVSISTKAIAGTQEKKKPPLEQNYVHRFLIDRSQEVINHWNLKYKKLRYNLNETARLRRFFNDFKGWHHRDLVGTLSWYIKARIKRIKNVRERERVERDIILALYHYVKAKPFRDPGIKKTLTINDPITMKGMRNCYSGSELLIGIYNKFGLGGRTVIVEVFTKGPVGHVALFYFKPTDNGKRVPFVLDVNTHYWDAITGRDILDCQINYEKIGVYDLTHKEMFYESYKSFLSKCRRGRVRFSKEAVRASNDIIFKATSPKYIDLMNDEIKKAQIYIRPEKNEITKAIEILNDVIKALYTRMIFYEKGDKGWDLYKEYAVMYKEYREKRASLQKYKAQIYIKRGLVRHGKGNYKGALSHYEVARTTLRSIEKQYRDKEYKNLLEKLNKLVRLAKRKKRPLPWWYSSGNKIWRIDNEPIVMSVPVNSEIAPFIAVLQPHVTSKFPSQVILAKTQPPSGKEQEQEAIPVVQKLIDKYKLACKSGTVAERMKLRDELVDHKGSVYSYLLKYLDIGKINTWGMHEKSAWKMHYMALNVTGRCFENLSPKEQYAFAQRVKKFIAYIDSKTLPPNVKSFYSSPNLQITRNMIEALCDERMINIYEIKNPDLPQESKHKKAFNIKKYFTKFVEKAKKFVKPYKTVIVTLISVIGALGALFSMVLCTLYFQIKRQMERSELLSRVYIESFLADRAVEVLALWHKEKRPLQEKLLETNRLEMFFNKFTAWDADDVLEQLARYIKDEKNYSEGVERMLVERDIMLALYHYVKDKPFEHTDDIDGTMTLFHDEILDGKRTCFAGSELLLGIFEKFGFSDRVLLIDVITGGKEGHVALFYFRPNDDGRREPFVMDVNYHQQIRTEFNITFEDLDWQVPYRTLGYYDLEKKKMTYESYDSFLEYWRKSRIGMLKETIRESNDILLKTLSPEFYKHIVREQSRLNTLLSGDTVPDFKKAYSIIDGIIDYSQKRKAFFKLHPQDKNQYDKTVANHKQYVGFKYDVEVLEAEYYISLGVNAHNKSKFGKAKRYYKKARKILTRIPKKYHNNEYLRINRILDQVLSTIRYYDPVNYEIKLRYLNTPKPKLSIIKHLRMVFSLKNLKKLVLIISIVGFSTFLPFNAHAYELPAFLKDLQSIDIGEFSKIFVLVLIGMAFIGILITILYRWIKERSILARRQRKIFIKDKSDEPQNLIMKLKAYLSELKRAKNIYSATTIRDRAFELLNRNKERRDIFIYYKAEIENAYQDMENLFKQEVIERRKEELREIIREAINNNKFKWAKEGMSELNRLGGSTEEFKKMLKEKKRKGIYEKFADWNKEIRERIEKSRRKVEKIEKVERVERVERVKREKPERVHVSRKISRRGFIWLFFGVIFGSIIISASQWVEKSVQNIFSQNKNLVLWYFSKYRLNKFSFREPRDIQADGTNIKDMSYFYKQLSAIMQSAWMLPESYLARRMIKHESNKIRLALGEHREDAIIFTEYLNQKIYYSMKQIIRNINNALNDDKFGIFEDNISVIINFLSSKQQQDILLEAVDSKDYETVRNIISAIDTDADYAVSQFNRKVASYYYTAAIDTINLAASALRNPQDTATWYQHNHRAKDIMYRLIRLGIKKEKVDNIIGILDKAERGKNIRKNRPRKIKQLNYAISAIKKLPGYDDTIEFKQIPSFKYDSSVYPFIQFRACPSEVPFKLSLTNGYIKSFIRRLKKVIIHQSSLHSMNAREVRDGLEIFKHMVEGVHFLESEHRQFRQYGTSGLIELVRSATGARGTMQLAKLTGAINQLANRYSRLMKSDSKKWTNKERMTFKLLETFIGKDKKTKEAAKDPKKLADLIEMRIKDNKLYNQQIGYLYLYLLWDRYNRINLVSDEKGNNIFEETDLDFTQPRGFSAELATIAAYNGGRPRIDRALLSYGGVKWLDNIRLKKRKGAIKGKLYSQTIVYVLRYLDYLYFFCNKRKNEFFKLRAHMMNEAFQRIRKRNLDENNEGKFKDFNVEYAARLASVMSIPPKELPAEYQASMIGYSCVYRFLEKYSPVYEGNDVYTWENKIGAYVFRKLFLPFLSLTIKGVGLIIGACAILVFIFKRRDKKEEDEIRKAPASRIGYKITVLALTVVLTLSLVLSFNFSRVKNITNRFTATQQVQIEPDILKMIDSYIDNENSEKVRRDVLSSIRNFSADKLFNTFSQFVDINNKNAWVRFSLDDTKESWRLHELVCSVFFEKYFALSKEERAFIKKAFSKIAQEGISSKDWIFYPPEEIHKLQKEVITYLELINSTEGLLSGSKSVDDFLSFVHDNYSSADTQEWRKWIRESLSQEIPASALSDMVPYSNHNLSYVKKSDDAWRIHYLAMEILLHNIHLLDNKKQSIVLKCGGSFLKLTDDLKRPDGTVYYTKGNIAVTQKNIKRIRGRKGFSIVPYKENQKKKIIQSRIIPSHNTFASIGLFNFIGVSAVSSQFIDWNSFVNGLYAGWYKLLSFLSYLWANTQSNAKIIICALTFGIVFYIGKYLWSRFMRPVDSKYGRPSYWRGRLYPSKLECDTAIVLRTTRLLRRIKKGHTWQVPFVKNTNKQTGYIDFFVRRQKYRSIFEPHKPIFGTLSQYRRERLAEFRNGWPEKVKGIYFYENTKELVEKILPEVLGRKLKKKESRRIDRRIGFSQWETKIPILFKIGRLIKFAAIIGIGVILFSGLYNVLLGTQFYTVFEWFGKFLHKCRYDYFLMNVFDPLYVLVSSVVAVIYLYFKKLYRPDAVPVTAVDRKPINKKPYYERLVAALRVSETVQEDETSIGKLRYLVDDDIVVSNAQIQTLYSAFNIVRKRYFGMFLEFYSRGGKIRISKVPESNSLNDNVLVIPYTLLNEAQEAGEESPEFRALVERVIAYGLWYESPEARQISDKAVEVLYEHLDGEMDKLGKKKAGEDELYLKSLEVFKAHRKDSVKYFMEELYFVWLGLIVPPSEMRARLIKRAEQFNIETEVSALMEGIRDDKEDYLKVAFYIAAHGLIKETRKIDPDIADLFSACTETHLDSVWRLMAQPFSIMNTFTQSQACGNYFYKNIYRVIDTVVYKEQGLADEALSNAMDELQTYTQLGVRINIFAHETLLKDRRFSMIRNIIQAERERGVDIQFVEQPEEADMILAFEDEKDITGSNVFSFSREHNKFLTEVMFFESLFVMVVSDVIRRTGTPRVDFENYVDFWVERSRGKFMLNSAFINEMKQEVEVMAPMRKLIRKAA